MLHKNNRPHFAMTVAGSDSGGGAGIQADLKAFAASGCFGLSAITAVTAQNTQAVRGVFPMSAEAVLLQIQTLADDFAIGACKTGMLVNAQIVRSVSQFFRDRRVSPIVDPVMIATSGAALLQSDAIDAYDLLITQADLITPNLPEAQALIGGEPIQTRAQMKLAAKKLIAKGARAVLLKGGHGSDQRCWDLLMIAGSTNPLRWFSSKRLPIRGHGTGCTLSALITGFRARGMDLETATEHAIRMLQKALRGMPPVGRTQATTPDPFFKSYR
jgi:hydroxymethylpyrimidine kinase/phosphomethylpyrimidine kinase